MTTKNEAAWNQGARNPWIIALTVTLATFMEILDTSIANVSLPHIAGGLAASTDESTWVLTSYLVSNASVLPLSGWFSSIFGRKNFYRSCVFLFTLSSFLCGLAPSLALLVLFRILQGAAGGGLQPSEQAILVDTFPRERLGMGMAVYGVAVLVAPILGPILGGWITDNYSWRWIFFINIPVGILSLALTSFLIQDPPNMARKGVREGMKIDYVGLGLLGLGLGSLQIVLDRGQREDWFDSPVIATLAILAAIALVAAYVWELSHKDPMVDVSLTKDRNFLFSNLTMFMLGFMLYGSILLLPLLLQTLEGFPATAAGLAIAPGALGTMFLMPVVGGLVRKVQARWLIIVGLLVLAASGFMMAGFNLDTDFWAAVTARLVQGVGLAFLFIPINVAAYSFVPPEKSNAASALINLGRNMGGSVGIATATTILARRSQFHQHILAGHLTPLDNTLRQGLSATSGLLASQGAGPVQSLTQAQGVFYGELQRQSAMMAFVDAFWLIAMVAVLSIPLALLLKKIDPTKAQSPAH